MTSLISDLFPAPDPAAFPTLTGRQAPHHLSVFDGDDTDGWKAVTLGERVTQPLMPWQQGNLRCLLRRNPDGSWTHPDAVLICPRQNGKSEIVLLRVLYGLFKLGEKILYTVQRWDTGLEIHDRLVAIIMSRPSLRRQLAKAPTSGQGRGRILLKSGAQIVTSTRSADVGRGLTKLDLVVYDEAYNLDEAASSAVDFAQMAAADPQTIYTSSAVNAELHPKGKVLAGLRRSGLARRVGMFFAEYMAPPEMPHDEVATWEYANPSYGVIQTAEKVRKLLLKAVTAAGRIAFGVDALGRGVWPRDEAEVERVIDPEVWSNLRNPAPVLTGQIALAVDRSFDRQWWAVVAAQRTDDSRIHLEVGYFQSASTGEVVAFLEAVIAEWDPCVLVIDKKSPANVLEPLLRNVGVEPEMTTAPQMVTACGGFYDAAMEGTLSHTDQPALTDAVADAVKRTLPGGDWAWDRASGGGVIAPLVAASLARWGLVTFGATVTGPVADPSVEHYERVDDEFDAMAVGF